MTGRDKGNIQKNTVDLIYTIDQNVYMKLTKMSVLFYVFFAEKSFLITEYCPKGSLQDILEDEGFELDNDFK